MADPDSAARGRCDQWRLREEVVAAGGDDDRFGLQRSGVRDGVVGGDAIFIAVASLYGVFRALDSVWQFQRGFRFLSRSAFAGDAAGGDGRGISDPHLLRRLHVGRSQLLPLLQLSESVHVLHADADSGGATIC